jgi:hypothetical protein
VNVSNTSLAVTGTFWQATQPVSLSSLPALPAGSNTIGAISNTSFGINGSLPAFAATPTVNAAQSGSWALTANAGTNLNTSALALENGGNLATIASAQGASGTGITQPTGGSGALGWLSGIYSKLSGTLTTTATISGTPNVNVSNSSIPVTGAFWQTTQPVSIATLPALSTGANTIGAISNSSFGISGTLPAFAATPTVTVGNASLAVTGTFWQATQPVSAASLPLPSGAASAANQTSVTGSVSAGTAAANSLAIGGVYNSTLPTLTTGQQAAIQVDSSGRQLVNVAALPALPAGANTIGAISNTSFAATQSGTWNAGRTWTLASGSDSVTATISGTVPVSGTFWQSTQPVSIASLPSLASGSNTVGSVGVNNKPVGPANIATSQSSPGTTATLLVAARTGAVGTGRATVTLKNFGSATVYVGASGVTTSTGFPLAGGDGMSVDATSAIYGIVSGGTGSIAALEAY